MLIEVFKTGSHIDASGMTQVYSTEMLNTIVANYQALIDSNPNNMAPLVKGHPKTNEPALG